MATELVGQLWESIRHTLQLTRTKRPQPRRDDTLPGLHLRRLDISVQVSAQSKGVVCSAHLLLAGTQSLPLLANQFGSSWYSDALHISRGPALRCEDSIWAWWLPGKAIILERLSISGAPLRFRQFASQQEARFVGLVDLYRRVGVDPRDVLSLLGCSPLVGQVVVVLHWISKEKVQARLAVETHFTLRRRQLLILHSYTCECLPASAGPWLFLDTLGDEDIVCTHA